MKILCLDFDGVLHSYSSGWQGPRIIPDPPVDGAIDFLLCSVDVFSVHIYSSRSNYWGGRRAMKKWLRRQLEDHYWLMTADRDWPGDERDERIALWIADVMKRIHWPRKKPPAHVTIDDRALTFTGIWPDRETIEGFRPWNKKGLVVRR